MYGVQKISMDQTLILLSRMEDLAAKAEKAGCAASRFLTPAEAQGVEAFFKRKRVDLIFDGGFDGAERVRAVFLNPDWGKYERSDLFAALKIMYRQQDAVGHRDILGAIMALGIERDTIGDIVVLDNQATVVCLPELSGYIIENLSKAGRAGINISEVSLGELQQNQEELEVRTFTVASLRLDAVLCAAFGLSRTKASELIAAGLVSLDHQQCLQSSKAVGEGALISVRGTGRAILLEIGGTSKKGRTFVKIGLYSRK